MKNYFTSFFVLAFCLLSPLQAAEPDYFTVKNTHASQKLSVKLNRNSYAPTNVTLNYRLIDAANNAGEWQTVTSVSNSSNCEIGDIPAGSRMQFYGNNPSGFAQSTMKYWTMYFEGSGTAVLSGELMSVFSGTETSIDLTKTLPSYAFYNFFYNVNAKNKRIVSTKDLKLSATNLGQNCYGYMFAYCSNMTDAPQLLATTMASNCYYGMFSYCSSLTNAPQLPATTLASNCYNDMFSYCTSLTTAPQLPVTTLVEGCYQSMFQGCTALVNVQPELHGTNMPANCYQYMFSGCTALTTAPEIMSAADAVAGLSACDEMFAGCTSLTKAPSKLLPAKLGKNMTYSHMLYNCPNLEEGPDIYATNITANNPLEYMYHSSSKLRKIRVYFQKWGSMSFSSYWTYGVNATGAFYCPPELARKYNGDNSTPSYMPDNWTIFSYNLTYRPVEGEWPRGGTDPQQYTWQTDTNYVQGWMRDLDAAGASYWHDQACTESFPEEEIIAFLATQQESSSDITKNIYVKLGAVNKVKITFIDHDDKVLAEINVPVGSLPAYPYDNPAPYSVGDKIFSFVGWSPTIVEATENATYRAVYSDSERYAFVVYPLAEEDQNEFECSPAAKPVVLTNDATSVTSGGAVLNGQVTSDGGQTVSERGFCWGTSSESLTNCTATGDGTVTFSHTLSGLDASTTYYYQAYATNGIGTARGEVKSFTTEAEVDLTCNHEWVQLWEGGPKWATVNIGATTETEAGNYYMYGDTRANENCWWSNCPYKGTSQSSNPYTKYGVSGDGRLVLEEMDDPATQAWGCGWRTPTKEEMDALKTYCDITCDATNKGIRCTSKTTGQSIFLPSAGYRGNGTGSGTTIFQKNKYGKYLTATSSATSGSSKDRDFYQYMWYTNSTYSAFGSGGSPSTSLIMRCIGMSVRAVHD